MTDFQKAKELIESKNNIVVISHTNPDGDALGAALGMHHLLQTLNKSSCVVFPDIYPDFLEWMPGVNNALLYSQEKELVTNKINNADLLICVDFNAIKRIGDLADVVIKSNVPGILIDHHLEPESFCNLIISDTAVSSTAELIYMLIDACDYTNNLNKDIASCLFVGIMTDTGSFSYAANRPETYRITANLIATGINARDIHTAVYNTYTDQRIRLLGYCLSEGLFVMKELKTAYIVLSKEILKRFNYKHGDTEGVVNYPLAIEGIDVAVLFIEKDNEIKLSLRSKGSFSVNEFARNHFNGGGHLNASGGTSYEPLQTTVQQFIDIIQTYKDRINP